MAPPPSTNSRVRELQQMLGLTGAGESGEELYFICIDLEAFEHNQNTITEIGVAVLSSSLIRGIDAGADGSSWFDRMQHLHLRPQETSHLVNKNFIKGCPDKFNFGTSVLPKLADCGKILQRIFNDPSKLIQAADLEVPIENMKPKIALVGHDLSNDTKYMRKLNFSPTNITARLDTQSLSRPSKASSPGLLRLLQALEIDATNLHNAGNDAAYTLQALVGIAVREHHEPGSVGTAVETAFRNARLERGLRKGKPRTFKEARERAAQDAAAASKLEGSQVESAPVVAPLPSVALRGEAAAPSLARRVSGGGSILVSRHVHDQAGQEAIFKRGFATAPAQGQRAAPSGESGQARKRRLRQERRDGGS